MADIVIYGASDHGRYTIDIVERAGRDRVVGVIDDRTPVGTELYGYPVIGSGAELVALKEQYGFTGGLVAIGDNWVRRRVASDIRALDPTFEFPTAIHPFTSIGRDASIGEGTVIMAGAVVNGSCIVGAHCFIATKASLDHDSRLGDAASMSPDATTGGRVSVGTCSTLSIGSTVIHGITIGDHTVIGAGSTVVSDIGDCVVAFGTPCRPVRERAIGDRYL